MADSALIGVNGDLVFSLACSMRGKTLLSSVPCIMNEVRRTGQDDILILWRGKAPTPSMPPSLFLLQRIFFKKQQPMAITATTSTNLVRPTCDNHDDNDNGQGTIAIIVAVVVSRRSTSADRSSQSLLLVNLTPLTVLLATCRSCFTTVISSEITASSETTLGTLRRSPFRRQ